MTASERVLPECFKLSRACTDGARTLAGRSTGCAALLGRVLLSKIWFYRRQEALCAKDPDFSRALNLIVCLISTMLEHALNQRFLPTGAGGNQCLPAILVSWCRKALENFWKLKEQMGFGRQKWIHESQQAAWSPGLGSELASFTGITFCLYHISLSTEERLPFCYDV